MPVRSTIFVAFALLTLSSCGGESAAATLQGTLGYSRSGGIAGLSEELTIQRDGRAKVTTREGSKAFKLSKEERSRVSAALEDADLANVKVKKTPAVPDSFIYDLRYRGAKLQLNDTNVPKAVKPLLTELHRLVKAHAPR
jgi:hypothetical protein